MNFLRDGLIAENCVNNLRKRFGASQNLHTLPKRFNEAPLEIVSIMPTVFTIVNNDEPKKPKLPT